MKLKKIFLGLGAMGAIATPIAAVVSCNGDEKTPFVDPTFGPKVEKTAVWFVTDGGKYDDKSFNQSAYEGVLEARGLPTDHFPKPDKQQIQKPAKSSEINEAYVDAKTAGAKLIVAAGFNHKTAMNEFASENPGMGFIAIDFDIKGYKDGKEVSQGNVATAFFNVKQAAFLEGVLAAKESSIKTYKALGVYGGMDITPVTDYIIGFKAGVKFWNDKQKSDDTKVKVIDGDFVGNFDTGGQSATIATKLVGESDMVLAVGGPQYQDVRNAIKAAKSNTKIIGVDTDLSIKDTSISSMIFGSILKNIKKVTNDIASDIMAKGQESKKLGSNYMGNLENDGVGVTQKHSDADKIIGDITWGQLVIEAKKL